MRLKNKKIWDDSNMADQQNLQQNPMYLKRVTDNAERIALARGEKTPSWNDLWLGMIEIPELTRAIAARGVDIASLKADLEYASRFGISKLHRGSEPHKKSAIEIAREDFLKDIEDFQAAFLGNQQTTQGFASSIMSDDDYVGLEEGRQSNLRDHARQLSRLFSYIKTRVEHFRDDMDADVARLKNTLLSMVVNNVQQRISLAVEEAGGLANMLGGTSIPQMVVSILHAEVRAIDGVKHPASYLEAIQSQAPMMTPNDVVKMMISMSGAFYEQLMIRNGEYATDPGYKDRVSAQFPGFSARNLAVDAIKQAYEHRSEEVDVRHVVMALLDNWSVSAHLSALGVKDLVEFSEHYEEAVFPENKKDEPKVRRHPKITKEFRDLIADIDAFVAEQHGDTPKGPKILRKLIKDDASVDAAMSKAGLLRRMLKGWNAPYRESEEKKPEEKKSRKPKGPKVSDEELEDLISRFCIDYTKLAAAGKFDPTIGNEDVLDQVATTVLKKGKKNPMLTGEPGVGKTKILEGFAQRIVRGKVPKPLVGSRLLYLDLHAMNDSPYISMFETKLKTLLEGVSERNARGNRPPIQIAIDEFAGAQDAGGHMHSEGAATIMKPYLTSGDLIVIGATTNDEYEKKVEKDGAVARRFNRISVSAPSVEETVQIIEGLQPKYSSHHGLRIGKALLRSLVEHADKYIHTGNQPDNSIDLLDHACAIAVSSGAKSLASTHIHQATSAASGIPVDFLSEDDDDRYVRLPETLMERILDQNEAIAAVSEAIQRSKAGLSDPETPTGTFLFLGPTGVGKTELARALADTLYGGEDFLLRYDMSEYMERHAASRFTGAPPGYVGYDDGGGLVKDVRQKPYSVILYDEFEKADPDIPNVLLAPFSSGMITDSRGKKANMRHTINIMTSNLGASEVNKRGMGFGNTSSQDRDAIYMAEAQRHFRPEFLNRLDGIVIFNSLSMAAVEKLTRRQVELTGQRLRQAQRLNLVVQPELVAAVMQAGHNPEYGARPLKRAWEKMVANPLSAWLLAQPQKAKKRASKVSVSKKSDASNELEFSLEVG
nr:AAA domain-containing protein [Cytophagales bacterium]